MARLIDADALKEQMNENLWSGSNKERAMRLVDDAPTIAQLDKTEKAIIKMFRKQMFLAADNDTIRDTVAWSLYQVWKWFDEHRKGRRNDGH